MGMLGVGGVSGIVYQSSYWQDFRQVQYHPIITWQAPGYMGMLGVGEGEYVRNCFISHHIDKVSDNYNTIQLLHDKLLGIQEYDCNVKYKDLQIQHQ